MRSTSGFVFSLGSGAISWSIKKQSTVALSRIEAKYKGTVVLACEAVWLKRIFNDLGVPISDPIFLYCDNISIIHLARNPVFHTRTKHIEVHYHFARKRILTSEVKLNYVPNDQQVANIFTKPLGCNNDSVMVRFRTFSFP